MTNDDLHEKEWDAQAEKKHSRRSGGNNRIEEDAKKLAEDNAMLAREVLLLKKEMNRLHYKVKSYNNQNRVVNAIINTVVIALLLVITYRLYATAIPHIPLK